MTLRGAAEFSRFANDLSRSFDKRMQGNYQGMAFLVAQRARSRAPVRTGRLRDNIRTGKHRYGFIVRVGSKTRVPYAGPIHFGWPRRGIVPNPFLYDALDERRQELLATYTNRVQDLIDRGIRKSGAAAPPGLTP